ncbi:hypothetical protein [Corynebacterium simulans]|uniref:hypothetical protein n=2 Tax=Corynebacterium TaxID=1716 RepID=UPI001F27E10D|nr:hypothetical protein [Corynebacterium simulans]
MLFSRFSLSHLPLPLRKEPDDLGDAIQLSALRGRGVLMEIDQRSRKTGNPVSASQVTVFFILKDEWDEEVSILDNALQHTAGVASLLCENGDFGDPFEIYFPVIG